MAIPRINGLSSVYTQNLYRKTKENENGKEYSIDPGKKEALIKQIYEQIKAGIISEQEGQSRIDAIESAPQIFSVDGSFSTQVETHLTNENIDNIQKREERQRQKEITQLEEDYKNGVISEFTYKANMYFLNPPSSDNNDGQSLNVMA